MGFSAKGIPKDVYLSFFQSQFGDIKLRQKLQPSSLSSAEVLFGEEVFEDLIVRYYFKF